MRRLFVLLLSAGLITMASAAPLAPVSRASGPVTSAGIDVAFLIPNTDDTRWRQDGQTFGEQMQTAAGRLSWVVLNAENSEAQQIQQAREAVNGGTKVLVVSPVNPVTASIIVAYAHAHGTKVIAYDRPINTRGLDLYVGYDPQRVGQLQADFILNHVAGGSLFVINGPPSDQVARLQYKGLDDPALTAAVTGGRYRTFYPSWTTAWSSTQAEKYATSDVFSSAGPGSGPSAIGAMVGQNDVLASGIIRVVGPDHIKTMVIGAGSSLGGLRKVIEGKLRMTVFKAGKLEAQAAASGAISLARGTHLPPAFGAFLKTNFGITPAALFQPAVVTASTIDKNVIDPGYVGSTLASGPMNVQSLCWKLIKRCQGLHLLPKIAHS